MIESWGQNIYFFQRFNEDCHHGWWQEGLQGTSSKIFSASIPGNIHKLSLTAIFRGTLSVVNKIFIFDC